MTVDYDYFGTLRGDPPDIGADEYSSGSPPASPTTYTFDPSGETTASNPIGNGWTLRSGTAFVSSAIAEGATPCGTKYWRMADSDTSLFHRFLAFDEIESTSIFDVLILFRRNNYTHSIITPMARLSATGDIAGYEGGLSDSADTIRIRKHTPSRSTVVSGPHSISDTVDEWIFVRFNCDGASLRAREWEPGNAEPETWTISGSDASYSDGTAGLYVYLAAAGYNDANVDIAWFSCGTGGASAPSPTLLSEPEISKEVYWSVCTFGTGDLKTGSPEISISGGVATLSIAQTGNIGIGCRITYDTTEVCFIRNMISQSVFQVVDIDGNIPANATAETVNSIRHEFASLSNAFSGAADVNHLNTSDLVSGEIKLFLVLYGDHDDDTPDTNATNAFTADSDYFVTLYSPGGGNESNIDWRAKGKDTGCYRLVNTTGGTHALNLTTAKCVMRDFTLKQASSGTSDECARISTPGTFDFTRIGFFCGDTLIASQDGVYYDQNDSATFNFESCVFNRIGRAGININSYQTSVTKTITVNMNSCTGFDIGHAATSDYAGFVSIHNNYASTTINVNIFNSIGLNCVQDVFNQNADVGTTNWNIDNGVDSDGSIDDCDGSAYKCLVDRTWSDVEGAADVIFQNVTTLPYDLSLKGTSANNQAIQMHGDGSGAGLVMPSVDILLQARPLNALYCCGAYEIQEEIIIYEAVKPEVRRERKENRKVLVKTDVNGDITDYGSIAIDKLPQIENIIENETLIMVHDKNADRFQQMERGIIASDFAKALAHNFRESSVVNGNGTAIRYRDGFQICYVHIPASESDAPDNAVGSIFRSDNVEWVFPMKFHRVFLVQGQCLDSGGWVTTGLPSSTSVNYREFSPSSTSARGVKIVAWGTWK